VHVEGELFEIFNPALPLTCEGHERPLIWKWFHQMLTQLRPLEVVSKFLDVNETEIFKGGHDWWHWGQGAAQSTKYQLVVAQVDVALGFRGGSVQSGIFLRGVYMSVQNSIASHKVSRAFAYPSVSVTVT